MNWFRNIQFLFEKWDIEPNLRCVQGVCLPGTLEHCCVCRPCSPFCPRLAGELCLHTFHLPWSSVNIKTYGKVLFSNEITFQKLTILSPRSISKLFERFSFEIKHQPLTEFEKNSCIMKYQMVPISPNQYHSHSILASSRRPQLVDCL